MTLLISGSMGVNRVNKFWDLIYTVSMFPCFVLCTARKTPMFQSASHPSQGSMPQYGFSLTRACFIWRTSYLIMGFTTFSNLGNVRISVAQLM